MDVKGKKAFTFSLILCFAIQLVFLAVFVFFRNVNVSTTGPVFWLEGLAIGGVIFSIGQLKAAKLYHLVGMKTCIIGIIIALLPELLLWDELISFHSQQALYLLLLPVESFSISLLLDLAKIWFTLKSRS